MAPPSAASGKDAAAKAANDSEAVRLWVEEHGDYLFRYALRHFPNSADAEELVQETFLAAVQGARSFQGNSAARTWLTGILRHKIIDRIRKKQSDRSISFEDAVEDCPAGLFDAGGHWTGEGAPREWDLRPDAAFERKDFFDKLNQCMQRLPDRFRAIFLMREIDGLSREEIGEQSGVTANNIGVILHRARILLRECLQKNWLRGSSS